MRKLSLALVAGLCAAALPACRLVPVSGPTAGQVVDHKTRAGEEYVVVDLSASVVQQLAGVVPHNLSDSFGTNAVPAPQTFGAGDVVSVTIWEAAAGGLFTNPYSASASGIAPSSGARSIVVPNQSVSQKGEITIPYGGQVHIAGLTVAEAQDEIVRRLQRLAIDPQALITLVYNQNNAVTVSGDVVNPGIFPLNLHGTHILDVISQANGSKWPAYDTTVQLTRNGRATRVRMEAFIVNPAENILLQANDIVHVIRDPQTVAVLGATNQNALVPFDTTNLTLAEALGKAGGLNTNLANPTGVFVFRYEPLALVHAFAPETASRNLPDSVPVIFRANMRNPETYFLSHSFRMSDKDVVYVSNTESVQFSELVNLFTSPAVYGWLFTR
jgi:polysaccharide export outer membrane protein